MAVILTLLPCLYLEYLRVRSWWARMAERMKRMEHGAQPPNTDRAWGDLAMILLQADSADDDDNDLALFLGPDVSSVLRRSWLLLIESMTVLESSVPVVRCATVACAAAELTGDTACLVDMALEVRKRGLVGGVGMMLWDAFFYHLSLELKERRKQDATDRGDEDDASGPAAEEETHGKETDGQYTGAVVRASKNLGRLSHNISCLMDHQENDYDGKMPSGNASGDGPE